MLLIAAVVDSIAKSGRKLAAEFAVLRTRDFERKGIPRQCLGDLVGAGIWEKIGHGLYASIILPPGPHHSLLEVARQSPHAVVCLLSALRFHVDDGNAFGSLDRVAAQHARPPHGNRPDQSGSTVRRSVHRGR